MKLLIELPTWLGDTVMTTPAFENLVACFDDPEITIIGSAISIEVLKNHPRVIRSYVLSKKYNLLIRQVRILHHFDFFISFRNSFRSRVLKIFVSATSKYQFNKSNYKNRHVVEKYNDFIKDIFEINRSPGRLKIYQDNNSVLTKSRPSAGINPGASYGDAKRWNVDKFAEVALELSSQYEIIIFGGPNEVDIAIDIEKILIKNGVENFHNLAGKTSIKELIEYISSLQIFITGDSGPMHLASSFQVPTVSIFGPTLDNETSQWKNNQSIIIKKNLDCQPCMKRTCPLKHHNCMNLIEVEEVLSAASSLN
jgi:heptosyltransferase II